MDVRGWRVLLCVLVVLGCSIALASGVSAVGAVDSGTGSVAFQDASGSPSLDDADEIHTDIYLHENGSATVAVDYRYEIDEENTTESEWERLQREVEANPEPFVDDVESGWSETVAAAENETERTEMSISNGTVGTETTSTPRETGHVEFTFEWKSFAHVELNRIEAGDALTGFTIQDDTGLQIHWPEAYTLSEEPAPTPDETGDNSVYWGDDGPGFDDDEPRVILIEDGTTDGEAGVANGDGPGDQPSVPWVAVAAVFVLLVVVGATGWWIRDQQGKSPTASTQAGDGDTTGDGEQANPPPELLSNEERVLQLLDSHGGRIKQQEVVSELDWTEAKTSQVVSGLREADEIEVFRIGRENVLTLSTEDTDTAARTGNGTGS